MSAFRGEADINERPSDVCSRQILGDDHTVQRQELRRASRDDFEALMPLRV
jgi:hypothetical protein